MIRRVVLLRQVGILGNEYAELVQAIFYYILFSVNTKNYAMNIQGDLKSIFTLLDEYNYLNIHHSSLNRKFVKIIFIIYHKWEFVLVR